MILPEFSLKGKVAIITGNGRGFTGALASALAEAGAQVAVVARSSREAKEAAKMVAQAGAKALALRTDVTKAPQVERMVAQVVQEFGQIDILVNNLCLEFAKPLVEVTKEEWQRLLDANITSVFLCSKAVGRHMLSRKQGHIINIISGLAVRGMPHSAPFCATMGAVLQFTKALGVEWAREGVRVTGIGPGWFASEKAAEEGEPDPLERYIPLRRRGQPEELGALLVYLASDAADYVTGQTIFVDGGVLAHA